MYIDILDICLYLCLDESRVSSPHRNSIPAHSSCFPVNTASHVEQTNDLPN